MYVGGGVDARRWEREGNLRVHQARASQPSCYLLVLRAPESESGRSQSGDATMSQASVQSIRSAPCLGILTDNGGMIERITTMSRSWS